MMGVGNEFHGLTCEIGESHFIYRWVFSYVTRTSGYNKTPEVVFINLRKSCTLTWNTGILKYIPTYIQKLIPYMGPGPHGG